MVFGRGRVITKPIEGVEVHDAAVYTVVAKPHVRIVGRRLSVIAEQGHGARTWPVRVSPKKVKCASSSSADVSSRLLMVIQKCIGEMQCRRVREKGIGKNAAANLPHLAITMPRAAYAVVTAARAS